MTTEIIVGDCLDVLRTMPDESIQCCVTSPPYFGLRDYGHAGQLGLEKTPELYVEKMVAVFREVRRVLRDDGTLWLNIGDSYAGSGKGGMADGTFVGGPKQRTNRGSILPPIGDTARLAAKTKGAGEDRDYGLKSKDLIGIPWMLAFALRADGWYLRSDIIWHKPNPMPESVTDRPTKAHEYLFLLAKNARYYYDAVAVAEPIADVTAADPRGNGDGVRRIRDFPGPPSNGGTRLGAGPTRNRRSVWTIPTSPFPGAHFAVMPPKLVEPCILAGSPKDGTVLDPFAGAGTVGLVASRLGRSFIGIELNPKYAEMARQRIHNDAPLFTP